MRKPSMSAHYRFGDYAVLSSSVLPVSGALFSCGSPGSGTMLPSSCLRIRRQGSRRRTPAAGGARPSSTREPRGRCPSARHDPREDRIRGLAREGLAERRTNIMNIPRFTGEASLYPSTSSYRSRGYSRHGQSADSHAHTVVPAIPYCGNCDWILDNCERNGWRPGRYVTRACEATVMTRPRPVRRPERAQEGKRSVVGWSGIRPS